jgi:hypothetical protein
MNCHRIAAVVAAFLLTNSAASAATLGRVLYLAGEAQVQRGSELVALRSSADLLANDTIETGPDATLHLRLNSGATVALRGASSLRIGTGTDAPLRLLRGGLRIDTKAQRLLTSNADLVLRNAHANVAACAANCENDDGNAVAPGTYVALASGELQAGTESFGSGSYVFLNERRVERLLRAQRFFYAKLEPRLRASERVDRATASPIRAALQQVGDVTESRAAHGPPLEAAADERNNDGDIRFLAVAGKNDVAALSFIFSAAGAQDVAVSRQDGGVIVTDIRESLRQFTSTTAQSLSVSRQADRGGDNGLAWSRWQDASLVGEDGRLRNHVSAHTITGEASRSLPAGGTVVLHRFGGTAPTDFAGNVGRVVASATQATVNFATRTLSTTMRLEVAGQTYNLSSVDGMFGAGPAVGSGSLTGTCSGSTCGGGAAASGRYRFILSGNPFNAVGMAYRASAHPLPPGGSVAGTHAFHR